MPSTLSQAPVVLRILFMLALLPLVGVAGETMTTTVPYGFSRQRFDCQQGEVMYVLFVPFDFAPDSHPPLLIYLNGLGENGDDGTAAARGPLGRQIWDMKAAFPFVTIFPQCRADESWVEPLTMERTMQLVDHISERFHTDPDRIYITGASSGGTGAWCFGATFPDRFAAIVPLCGVGNLEKTTTALSERALPVWSFCNLHDTKWLVDAHRKQYLALLKAGVSPRYSELQAAGHNCWNYAYRNPALYEWLLSQRRSNNSEPSHKFQYIGNADEFKTLSQHPAESWSLTDDLVLASHASDSPAYLQLLDNSGTFDLHAEFHLGEAHDLRVWLTRASLEEHSAGTYLELTTPEHGSGGLHGDLSDEWICPTDPLAQRSLNRKGWNDLRIHKVHGDITIELNGYGLLKAQHDALKTSGRVALESRRPNDTVRWRYLRFRSLELPAGVRNSGGAE